MSVVPQGSVLGPILLILYTSDLFQVVESCLYGYASDTHLVACIPNLSYRVAVGSLLNADIARVFEW